jgi:c(7)-type cytochrome triheme protein
MDRRRPIRVAVGLATFILAAWGIAVAIGSMQPAGQGMALAQTVPQPVTGDGGPSPVPGAPVFASPWRPLEKDGLHDPSNRALSLLQQPEEALSTLPPAVEGNNVDWVAALRMGYIEPRTNIYPETKIQILDKDVIMDDTAGMPLVKFPHKAHTEWLDCANCHDKIFKAKAGANPVNMLTILQGEFCGQCHGAVSFPLTQCQRCHSVPRSK